MFFLLLLLELRAFLQTLLDLLQRAEDYIRDKMDLTFFTQTLPQLVEHIYSAAFTHNRERRDLGLTWIKGTGVKDHVTAPFCFIKNKKAHASTLNLENTILH